MWAEEIMIPFFYNGVGRGLNAPYERKLLRIFPNEVRCYLLEEARFLFSQAWPVFKPA